MRLLAPVGPSLTAPSSNELFVPHDNVSPPPYFEVGRCSDHVSFGCLVPSISQDSLNGLEYDQTVTLRRIDVGRQQCLSHSYGSDSELNTGVKVVHAFWGGPRAGKMNILVETDSLPAHKGY